MPNNSSAYRIKSTSHNSDTNSQRSIQSDFSCFCFEPKHEESGNRISKDILENVLGKIILDHDAIEC